MRGLQKVAEDPPKTSLKDVIEKKVTHTRREHLSVKCQYMETSLRILGGKIFRGLATLGTGMWC